MVKLVEVMDRLLAPDGCPWDREQTLDTLKPFLIEETYEVLEALDGGDSAEHCEELGDLLMQIVFQAALRRADGAFTIDDVADGITEKLIRRHPHIFADARADTPEQVLKQWDEIKAEEKRAAPRRTLDGVPVAMPALARAHKLTERAARVGFDWPDVQGCWDKVREELTELEQATRDADQPADAARDAAQDAIEAELGDVLFAVVNLARKLDCDPENALRGASRRFTDRFRYVEDRLADHGLSPRDASLEQMDALWDQAKRSADPP